MTAQSLILHGTCVDVAGKGVLITGASGSGKSSLALQLMALGAALVSDDRTRLTLESGRIRAAPPPSIAGLIEARGVGILHTGHTKQTLVHLVVDMDVIETKRLPDAHSTTLLDIPVRCLHKVDAPYFPAALIAYLAGSGPEVS
ncbi:HPr kinase/phosphatase C-terminal domain-containing protein [Sulfitobacter sp. S223]|uniref:HPr kinase/phosphorylase n=1 Tax=Sulfitobacter sp. S223 TaxID=2867023 RepID=UPI0021A8BA5E|nr:HPr kinase/phosphatase C-terminal domain-containing protein [Sulfitobacter sp. S223]UWR26883.1 HPr kinase/phosphatase C-terminal domain-containing protein [Sulfitobacter sp. S223]